MYYFTPNSPHVIKLIVTMYYFLLLKTHVIFDLQRSTFELSKLKRSNLRYTKLKL